MGVNSYKKKTAERRMKGDIILGVLECIAEGVVDFTELFMAIAEAGYGASSGRIEHVRARNRAAGEEIERAMVREREARRRYKKLISALKRDELIAEGDAGAFLKLTRKGMAKLAVLRKRKKTLLPPPTYEVERSDVFTIVAFDVPERERRKRSWLREALRNVGFTVVQKSVWMGKVTVPRELLEDIRRLRLTPFVEIFQITKRGTLKEVV